MVLTDMGDTVLADRAAIGLTTAPRVVELREYSRGAGIPVNPETGKRLHPDGQIGRMTTRVGEVSSTRECMRPQRAGDASTRPAL